MDDSVWEEAVTDFYCLKGCCQYVRYKQHDYKIKNFYKVLKQKRLNETKKKTLSSDFIMILILK